MRHGLLLTAAATVALPGLLAVLGVVSHEPAAAQSDVAMSSLESEALTGPFPVAPPTARAGVRNDVAAVQQAAGTTVTVLSRVTVSQQAMGMRLLGQAADASQAVSYSGTEEISQSGVDGSVSLVSEVWHQAGGQTLVQTSNASATATSTATSSDAASGSPEGVFGVTRSLVTLLGKHYVALYRGAGTAAGRPAVVVELYSFDGSLAARYWLDSQTMFPLRRELFDTADNVISEDSFVQVQLGARARAGSAVTGAGEPQSAWDEVSSPAQFVASLAARGWPVPPALLGGLPLYTAAVSATADGEVADLEYSDGLYVISLFVQRGELTADMSGWQPVKLAGQQAYVSGHSVTWAGAGYVYTMIADAPPQQVRLAVATLPASGSPGVAARFGRGLDRLARLAGSLG